MGLSPPAAVVLGALAAPVDPALDALLGEGAGALRDALVARARRWAAAVAPDIAFEATSAGAAGAALHDHEGPVLLAAWDVPGLDEGLAASALEDLRAGALVTIAPATDGRPFLVGVARADPELLELAVGPVERIMAAAAAHEGGIGMLRSERRLVTPGDARALAADPVAPAELTCHLAGVLAVRRTP